MISNFDCYGLNNAPTHHTFDRIAPSSTSPSTICTHRINGADDTTRDNWFDHTIRRWPESPSAPSLLCRSFNNTSTPPPPPHSTPHPAYNYYTRFIESRWCKSWSHAHYFILLFASCLTISLFILLYATLATFQLQPPNQTATPSPWVILCSLSWKMWLLRSLTFAAKTTVVSIS